MFYEMCECVDICISVHICAYVCVLYVLSHRCMVLNGGGGEIAWASRSAGLSSHTIFPYYLIKQCQRALIVLACCVFLQSTSLVQ